VKTTSGEEFHGAKCIITVGAWTSKLVRSVTGMDLPVQPWHTLLCYWKAKPGRERELTPEASFPTFASYGDPIIYGTPSMEFPGLIKIAMHGGSPCDPDSRGDMTTDTDAAAALVEPMARWIRDFTPDHIDTVQRPLKPLPCMYSMTPDEDFVMDFLGGDFGRTLSWVRGSPATDSRWHRLLEGSWPRWLWTGRPARLRRLVWSLGTSALAGLWTTRRETSGIIEIVNADEHRVLLEILPPTVFRMISIQALLP